jgi:hypothetical protein
MIDSGNEIIEISGASNCAPARTESLEGGENTMKSAAF